MNIIKSPSPLVKGELLKLGIAADSNVLVWPMDISNRNGPGRDSSNKIPLFKGGKGDFYGNNQFFRMLKN